MEGHRRSARSGPLTAAYLLKAHARHLGAGRQFVREAAAIQGMVALLIAISLSGKAYSAISPALRTRILAALRIVARQQVMEKVASPVPSDRRGRSPLSARDQRCCGAGPCAQARTGMDIAPILPGNTHTHKCYVWVLSCSRVLAWGEIRAEQGLDHRRGWRFAVVVTVGVVELLTKTRTPSKTMPRCDCQRGRQVQPTGRHRAGPT
jgi:hypothetical protein